MSIAITEEHRALAQTVSDLLAKHQTRAAARALLEAETEPLPDFWAELAGLGLLGLHIPADHGGSGFGLSETLVVAEQMGRQLAPGPYLPTVIASAVLAGALAAEAVPAGTASAWPARLLSGLADGTVVGAVALGGDVTFAGDTVTGDAGVVISGHLADVLLVPVGDDVALVERAAGGVTVTVPANLDQSRRAARVRLDAARRGAAHGRAPAADRHRQGRVRGRGHRDRHRDDAAGGRVRQGPGPVRPPDRHLPGGQAPLRQHAGRGRARHRRDLGRRPGRGRRRPQRRRRRSVQLHRRDRGDARDPGRGRQRQPQHPGARRHRVHLGARRAPVPAPGGRGRRDRGRRPGRGRGHRPGAARASAGRPRSTCPPRPSRSGRRSGRTSSGWPR